MGARYLEGTGLERTEVESLIQKQASDSVIHSTAITGEFWGRVQLGDTVVEYRAHTLSDGTIDVGTYHVRKRVSFKSRNC